MKRLAWVVASLALAGPAAAESTAVALDDQQLDQVAAGCDTHGTPTGTLAPTVNVTSPIVVNQTALAFNVQTQKANANGGNAGKAGKHGKHGKHGNGGTAGNGGTIKQGQQATALALNTVNINYHPKF